MALELSTCEHSDACTQIEHMNEKAESLDCLQASHCFRGLERLFRADCYAIVGLVILEVSLGMIGNRGLNHSVVLVARLRRVWLSTEDRRV